MNQVLSILVMIARVAGTKLPLVWPSLLVIAAELKKIAEILGVTVQDNPSFGFTESEASAELLELCRTHNCSEDECKQLVFATNAVDEAIDEVESGEDETEE